MTLESGDLEVSGGGFIGTFRVAQFHFHWGSNNSLGSEHTVDGRRFPLEVRVVIWLVGSLGGLLSGMMTGAMRSAPI